MYNSNYEYKSKFVDDDIFMWEQWLNINHNCIHLFGKTIHVIYLFTYK